ncbi:lysozyme inhibitor LprI family protein [Caballeronia sordidicola]|nr:lysozyme inhibitor LprI family protein [Caballeronia sordidicola]
MTIEYADNQVKLLLNDTFIPVTLGDVDPENGTVNFKGTIAATGKPAVWTVRQVWNQDKTSFTLMMTMHDGTQEAFGFVRKISTDDLNRIANLEVPATRGTSVAAVGAQAAAPAPTAATPEIVPATDATAQTADPIKVSAPADAVTASMPIEVPQVVAVNTPAPAALDAQTTAASPSAAPAQAPLAGFAPSFDCSKVSSGPERLICSSQELSQLDVELGQAYKSLMEDTPDAEKAGTKKDQVEWRKKDRDACSTADCVAKAYQDRIAELNTEDMHQRKPAEFK